MRLPCIWARIRPIKCEGGWQVQCKKGQPANCSTNCNKESCVFHSDILAREPASLKNTIIQVQRYTIQQRRSCSSCGSNK